MDWKTGLLIWKQMCHQDSLRVRKYYIFVHIHSHKIEINQQQTRKYHKPHKNTIPISYAETYLLLLAGSTRKIQKYGWFQHGDVLSKLMGL